MRASLLLLATAAAAAAHTAWAQQGRCCCYCFVLLHARTPDMMQSACMLHNIYAYALIATAAGVLVSSSSPSSPCSLSLPLSAVVVPTDNSTAQWRRRRRRLQTGWRSWMHLSVPSVWTCTTIQRLSLDVRTRSAATASRNTCGGTSLLTTASAHDAKSQRRSVIAFQTTPWPAWCRRSSVLWKPENKCNFRIYVVGIRPACVTPTVSTFPTPTPHRTSAFSTHGTENCVGHD